MKIAQYVETFGYVGMFNTMNFASYICLYLISPFMQHPVYLKYVDCMVSPPPALTLTVSDVNDPSVKVYNHGEGHS